MEFGRFALAIVGHFLASLLYVLRRVGLVSDEAVVDTTSILEHREELRELWEKRMMADDNQSSPSSATVVDDSKTRPVQEGGVEAEDAKPNSGSESKPLDHKLMNGFAKSVQSNHVEEDSNANHIREDLVSLQADEVQTAAVQTKDAEPEGNCAADSLEEDNADDFVEEKTYTSELETSLVVKQPTEVSSEEVGKTPTDVCHVEEKVVVNESISVESTTTTSCVFAAKEGIIVETSTVPTSVDISDSAPAEQASLAEKEGTEEVMPPPSNKEVECEENPLSKQIAAAESHTEIEVIIETVVEEKQIKGLEVELNINDDDGFVPVEDCLPKVDAPEDGKEVSQQSSEQDTDFEEQSISILNGHSDFVESSPATSTPEPTLDDKTNHPEMEQFVKSGGVKRILPGVQKTEQPYSTCTTETKIAMEIREMREREEELRLMREQALLSPVVSPVPPKSPSPRSPSPTFKESVPSPTPSFGPGYRVSSVFGHKGATSPSPPVPADDEKRSFKGFSKESAVEKEIRLARDREEELRKQKGLPPREDDSYVKPSQVKSSQVRVFGKMVGSNASVKQAATAKIQLEIEEQTQREMALRETGHIQTISQERTDAKVAKLKSPEPPITNGNGHSVTNGNYMNGHSSPDVAPYKRGSPSPTGARPASIFPPPNSKGGINMHKFIASKGKEATFSAPRNGAPFMPKEDNVTKASVPPPIVKLKRNVSVESKIQQEILEMKQREEELKLLHMNRSNDNSPMEENGNIEMNQKNNRMEYENVNGLNDEDLSPRQNKLIAQWEQRIQKAES